jgi:hypothetical protein
MASPQASPLPQKIGALLFYEEFMAFIPAAISDFRIFKAKSITI